MKKRISLILAVIMIMAVMVPALPVMSVSAATTDTWDPANEIYEISTVNDLKAFYADADTYANYDGKTITLKNDIVFNDTSVANWYETAANVITTSVKVVDATFNGGGFTIKGFCAKVSTPASNRIGIGFLGTANNSTIQNLTLDGYYINGTANGSIPLMYGGVGSLIGHVDVVPATVDDCVLKNGVLTSSSSTVGNVIGSVHGYYFDDTATDKMVNINVTNTTVEDTVVINDAKAKGGIIGFWGLNKDHSQGHRNDLILNGSNFVTELNPVGMIEGTAGRIFVRNAVWSTVLANGSDGMGVKTAADIQNAACSEYFKYGTGTWDPDKGIYKISTASDLIKFYSLAASNTVDAPAYVGKTITLEKDIVFNDTTAADWYVNAANKITNSVVLKDSIFDGQGHTITGFCANINAKGTGANRLGAGFIGTSINATVKDLTLDGYYITVSAVHTSGQGHSGVGTFIGFVEGGRAIVDGCTARNGLLDGAGLTNVGGVIANTGDGVLDATSAITNPHQMIDIIDTTIEDTVKLQNPVSNGRIGGIIGRWYMGGDWNGGNPTRYILALDGSVFGAEKADGTTLAPIDAEMIGADVVDGVSVPNRQRVILRTLVNGAEYETYGEIRNNEATSYQQYPDKFKYGEVNVSLAGYQLKGNDSIRFVGIVNDYTDLAELGFTITVGDVTKTVTVTKVYESLVAADQTVAPADGGKYFTFVITGIDVTTDFKVQTYSKTELGSVVNGVESTYTFTVNS